MTQQELQQNTERVKKIYADFQVELEKLKVKQEALVTEFTQKLQNSRVAEIEKQISEMKSWKTNMNRLIP